MLMPPVLIILATVFAAGSATKPDPNLGPIIDELVQKGRYDEVCQLYHNLETMAQKDFFQSQQMIDTLFYINESLDSVSGAEPCTSILSKKMPSEAIKLSKGPERLSLIGSNKASLMYEAEAVMAEGDDEQLLCDNCEVDYEAPETQEFLETFKKNPEVQAEEAMAKARSKLTKLFIFSVLGGIAVIVSITLTLFFGVRTCVRKMRRRRRKKSSLKSQDPPKNNLATKV